jgi:dienelactone hydrolase
VSHPTYRKHPGPGVIVIHEIPGMTPEPIRFGEEVVDSGYTVVMPHLFGTPGGPRAALDAGGRGARKERLETTPDRVTTPRHDHYPCDGRLASRGQRPARNSSAWR